MQSGVDLQIDPDLVRLGSDGFDHADRRVGSVAHAANDLELFGIRLPAERQEPFAKLRIFAAERNQNLKRAGFGPERPTAPAEIA